MSGAETVCALCGGNGWFYAWPSPDRIPCHRCASPRTHETREAETVCGTKHENGEVCVKDKGHTDYHGTRRESILLAQGGFFWWEDIATRTPETQGERRPDDLKALYREAVRQNSHLPSVAWQKVIELIERIERLEGAILWADGRGEDFPERQPGQGAYWWRKELMRRANLKETND